MIAQDEVLGKDANSTWKPCKGALSDAIFDFGCRDLARPYRATCWMGGEPRAADLLAELAGPCPGLSQRALFGGSPTWLVV